MNNLRAGETVEIEVPLILFSCCCCFDSYHYSYSYYFYSFSYSCYGCPQYYSCNHITLTPFLQLVTPALALATVLVVRFSTVVLMGECGCGKTMLISFLCKWLGVLLLSLDVHGGTVEADICKIFSDAKQALDRGLTSTVFVFLDEVNTCDHMGLITEAVCHRSIYGTRKILHSNFKFLDEFPAYYVWLCPSLIVHLRTVMNTPTFTNFTRRV